ncbi:MAG: Bug family tripartite tricarboxylate transporter substrate binding protein [Burkholderiales bacterium]
MTTFRLPPSALILGCAAGVAFVCATAAAQPYPSRPVRIVVPQAAGGGVDIMARSVAQKLTESWGQQVIVDNRPGANGIIGIEAVAKAKPDGYTLSAAFTSVLTINPHVYKSLPYDTFRDFAPISQTVTNTIVLIVHPSVPARSVKELVALGRSRSGQLDYGSFGIGNMTHLAGELLRVEAGLNMVHIPYKGETPALTELISGQVALLFAVSSAAAPHIRAGRARLLATGGEKRATAWPDTPTMIEAGYPRVVVIGWNGFLAPAGTPPEIIQKVYRDSARHLSTPELRDRLSALGAEPAGTTPDQFAAFLKSETEKWQRVSKAAGIYQSQ